MNPPLQRFYDRVAAYATRLDEDAAVAWAEDHGLYALAGQAALGPAVRRRLAEAARHNLAANLLLIRRFQEVCDAAGDVPICPVKGTYLLDTVYREDPGARRLGDLDLLVPPGDEERLIARLAERGWHETPGSRALGPGWHERSLSDGQMLLEIHTRLGVKHLPRSSWDELAPLPARVHGRAVHALDEETTLVHLVTHLVKHVPFTALRWVEDVLRWAARGGDGTAGPGSVPGISAARAPWSPARAPCAAWWGPTCCRGSRRPSPASPGRCCASTRRRCGPGSPRDPSPPGGWPRRGATIWAPFCSPTTPATRPVSSPPRAARWPRGGGPRRI